MSDAVANDEVGAVGRALLHETDLDLRPELTVTRVSGGYSWRTYVVTDREDVRVVVRVAPEGGTMEPYDPRDEQRILSAVPSRLEVPRVLAVRTDSPIVGRPYGVHSWLPGRVVRLGEVTDTTERDRYRRAFARTLGRIHRDSDPSVLGGADTITEAFASELERIRFQQVSAVGVAHPAFVLGLRWLMTHLPDVQDPPVLCHGDYRFHNLLWTGPGELSGILDWERAWAGDPMVDVAFGRRFSGWCAIEDDAGSDYEAAGGARIDADRVAYGLRFERVRSYTSSWRGWHALREGRSPDLALFAIGEAGERGVWGLRRWLERDAPLEPIAATGAMGPPPPLDLDWLESLARRADALGESQLAEHLRALPEADERARARSFAQLRGVADHPGAPVGLTTALTANDPEEAWGAAFALVAAAAHHEGPDLLPTIAALGERVTGRPTLKDVRADDV